MAKRPIDLGGTIDTRAAPADTGIPQRGAPATQPAKAAKRPGGKRLTLALDGDTYRRLRLHAAMTDRTHQSILEHALAEYLERQDA